MAAIIQIIAEKRRERDELGRRLERIDETIRRLEAARQVDSASDETPVTFSETVTGRPPILYISQVILREEKHPLHVKLIAKLAKERHGWDVKPSSIGTQLHKSLGNKRHGVFVKSKDELNTYGLRDYNAEPRDFRAQPLAH